MSPRFPLPSLFSSTFARRLGRGLLVAFGYAALAWLSVRMSSRFPQPSSFWPAAGFGVAALYLFGLRLWTGILAGSLVINWIMAASLPVNLFFSVGSVVEAVCGAFLLRATRDFNPRIGRLRDALLIISCGIVATGLNAFLAFAALIIGKAMPSQGALTTMFTWWAANLLGFLLLTPAILSWARTDHLKLTSAKRIELAVVSALGALAVWLIFFQPAASNFFATMPSVIFLFVVWVSLRSNPRVSTSFVLLLGCLVALGTMMGLGPFAASSMHLHWSSAQQAQFFIIICSIVSLLVSAITTSLHDRSEHLENSERRYRQLFDSGPDPLWIYSPETQKIVAVNQIAIVRLGYSRPEFLSLNVSDLFADEPELPSLATGSTTFQRREQRGTLKTKSGVEIQVRLSYRSADFFGESAIQLLAQDVSAQVRAADDLRRAEQRLNLHIEQTALGVIEWDADFRVTEWNPAAERIFGFCKQEAMGRTGLEFLVPEEVKPIVAEVFEKIVRTANPVRSMNDNVTKSGERIICEWFNTPLVDELGVVIGAASLIQDVTLRESIKESIRESEEKFRSVIESSPMGIQIYEIQEEDRLVLIGANPAAQNFMGFRNEELLGKSIEEAFPALARTNIPKMYRLAALEGVASWTDQVIYEESDFRSAYEVNAFQTVPGKMVAMFLDITERRRTEHALRLRDKAMEAISQGIVIISRNADGSLPIIYANPAFEKITGHTPAQIEGKSWRVLTGPESELPEVRAIEMAIAREHPVSVEMWSYRQDGTTFQSAISISPILDEYGRVSHYVGVYTDITGIKKLESQFRQSQKMEAIGRLAGGVAHDFNNLLTAIIGYNDLNLSLLEPDSKVRNNSLEIQKASERAASLTGQMLAFSRQQNLQPSRVPLNAVISGMYQLLARLIGETIEIKTVLSNGLADIKAGASQIEQVILNLAINARDAMPTGGILTLRTTNIQVSAALVADVPGITPGSYVLLSVSDNGTGMDERTKEHLFEPFFTTKEKGKGTGLGLATCYGIITQSGGFVTVHSRLGRGTTFDVYFPKMDPAEYREVKVLEETKVEGGSETILVVEDDPAVRPLTTNILRSLGYTVLEAGDGIEAQETLGARHTKIDLLLTDVVMPRMGGKELADWMKQEHPGTRILFTSGYLENPLSREDIGDEEAFFLRKPFTARSLGKKVRNVLDTVMPHLPDLETLEDLPAGEPQATFST